MVFVFLYIIFLPTKTHFQFFCRPFWFFWWPFQFFFADSWSSNQVVDAEWSSIFDIKLFYPLKLILNFLAAILHFFCGFMLFLWSCRNKVVFIFWYNIFSPPKTHFEFFFIQTFYPLKLIFNFFGGHFEFFWQLFWIFFRIPGLFIKLWEQSGLCFLI